MTKPKLIYPTPRLRDDGGVDYRVNECTKTCRHVSETGITITECKELISKPSFVYAEEHYCKMP